MRYEHTKIFQSAYILTVEIYKATSKFSKTYKYTIGEKLKDHCGDMLDIIVVANSVEDKKELLKTLNSQLEKIRIHLRLACDLKIISHRLLGVLNKHIEEIGRQLGGWQRWAEKQSCPSVSARVSVN